MYTDGKILVGCNDDTEVYLLPKLANRHGVIAGATGTGKTVTVKTLSEAFSDMGVPVFLADMKGDVAGLSKMGEASGKVQERVEKYSLQEKGFAYKSYPVEFWDLLGEKGLPVRVSISEIGPLLLSRILNLTDAQQGVLNVVFRVADDEGLLIIDIKDLKSMINYVTENKDRYQSQYGNIDTRSANTIIRALLNLEDQGGNKFFGEPALELNDLMQCDDQGRGIINILDSVKLSLYPDLYSTFLLWLMSELYDTLPEVGDLEKPKLVFFFDEAHLLFNNLSPVFLQKIDQIIRLIRSKGVGIYFISQNPSDIPDSILSQLGNRIQHSLRAYTPKDQKGVKVAAESFRENPEFSTIDAISNLEIGEALVSLLDEKGVPEMVQKVYILPPQSYLGSIDDEYRNQIMMYSVYKQKYAECFDRVSAYESLLEKMNINTNEIINQQANMDNSQQYNPQNNQQNNQQYNPQNNPQTDNGNSQGGMKLPSMGDIFNNLPTQTQTKRRSNASSPLDKVVTAATSTIAREVSKQIVRGIFGSMKK